MAAKAGSPEEGRLRLAVEQAVWPADIVRLSHQYLSEFPEGPAAGAARAWQREAADVMRVLERGDVQLYRGAFDDALVTSKGAQGDLRLAGLGDQQAAQRLAQRYLKGSDGLPQDTNRYVGWLQFASVLGSGAASYELALHYRKQDQPVLAAQYEARALSLGHVPPPALDHFRK